MYPENEEENISPIGDQNINETPERYYDKYNHDDSYKRNTFERQSPKRGRNTSRTKPDGSDYICFKCKYGDF